MLYEHPEDSSSFRPPAQGLTQRSWHFSEEGADLKEGTTDGDRMQFLQECTLNGQKLKPGTWVYFLSAAARHQPIKDILQDQDTTVWLGIILNIVKKVVGTNSYYHFLFRFKSRNGNFRSSTCTPNWIHAVVPERFQAMLNLDQQALIPFTMADPRCKQDAVTALGKMFKKSDEQTGVKKAKVDELALADASSRDDSGILKQLVEAKAAAKKLAVTLDAEKSISAAALRKLVEVKEAAQKDDDAARRLVQESIDALGEERTAKLKLESELRSLKHAYGAAESKINGLSVDSLNYKDEATRLQEELAAVKKKLYNSERVILFCCCRLNHLHCSCF